MLDCLTCPAAEELARYLLGHAPDERAGAIDRHLEECPRCLEALRVLRSDDSLAAALRDGRPDPVAVDTVVSGLIERLKDTAHGARVTDTTPAEPGPNGEVALDFLAPPRQAGERGRLGSYIVRGVLGTGGMGVVLRGEDPDLGRAVAIKVMHPALAADGDARQRFLREARALAALSHENVVAVYHVGQENGVPYVVMPLLVGESLEARLQREPCLPLAEALAVARQVAQGLAAAHERGLVHRDVKPGNIFLEKSGGVRVKLLDFGLVRAVEGEGRLTQSRTVLGTPAYMAPEQAEGEPADARSDLFSLGCVLYRMVTGVPPFRGATSLAILRALAVETPVPASQLNPAVAAPLEALLHRLLARRREDRPSSAVEIVGALEELEKSTPPAPRDSRTMVQPGPVPESLAVSPSLLDQTEPAASPPRRLPLRLGLLVAAAGLLLALAAAVCTIQTSKGTVVIETDDPDVEVVVRRGGEEVAILDGKSRQEVRLRAGEYVVELTKGKERVELKTSEFTLQRGDREIVRVKRTFVGAGPQPGDPEKPVPGGSPIGPGSLVVRPALLPGVKSWTVETIAHRGAVRAVTFSPDSKVLATGGDDGSIRLWNPRTGELVKILPGQVAPIVTLVYVGPNALKSFDDRGSVYVWDPVPGKLLLTRTGSPPQESKGPFSPDGRLEATGEKDGTVLIRDVRTAKVIRLPGHPSWDRMPRPHTIPAPGWLGQPGWDLGPVFAWSPDGKRFAIAGLDNHAVIYDAATAAVVETIHRLDDRVEEMAWSPNGTSLAFITDRNRLIIREGRFDVLTSSDTVSGPIAWSPDGKEIAVCAPEKEGVKGPSLLQVRDATTGKVLRSLREDHRIQKLAWSPTGKYLAAAYESVRSGHAFGKGSVRVFDAPSLRLLRTYREGEDPGCPRRPVDLLWKADGRHLIHVGEFSGNIFWVWDVEEGKTLIQVRNEERSSWASGALSPDGRWYATDESDRTATGEPHLVEVGTGKLRRDHSMAIPGMRVYSSWSPDSKTLVHRCENGLILFRDAASLAVRMVLAPRGPHHDLLVSPEGHVRGRAVDSGTLRYVVETENGQETLTPEEMLHKYRWKNEPKRVRP